MEGDGGLHGWDTLPDEILVQIIGHLEPRDLSRLQLVSRGLQKLCLDNNVWKRHCFESSPWYQALINRRSLHGSFAFTDDPVNGDPSDTPESGGSNLLAENQREEGTARRLSRRSQRLQDMANWDPSFPSEQVFWYDEYIQRQGPASVNWLETPRMSDGGLEAIAETRGVALYSPYGGDDGVGTKLAVSPLDDGTVCLWDINGTRGHQGGILAKSQPDLLYMDGSGNQNERLRSQRIDSSIADRVSVSNNSHRAYFAVQSHLIEVDLNRLDVVSRDSFEWSITTLSEVHDGVPLTVGTSLGVHLHDFRARARSLHDTPERVDGSQRQETDVFKSIFDPNPLPPYASLSQPTPTSILHLPKPGSKDLASDDIYVSGRFSNILHYDRRKFPAIVGSIHSGAVVNSLAAVPYPFSTVDHETRQWAELGADQVAQMKSRVGSTLVAGGSYNQKGSLEVYGLTPATDQNGRGTMLQHSLLKNRHTAASSPILSVTNHGTKVVFSDGSGLIKWFERDGTTECRRLRVGHSETDGRGSVFESAPQLDDVARKIVSTRTKHGTSRPNNDSLLFWTGERLGLVSFTAAPLYREHDFMNEEEEVAEEDKARHHYAGQMREALERQADEVKFLSRLGMGTRSSFGL